MNKIINIYTDGSSKGNPGPGGYGVFIETFFKNFYYKKVISEGYRYTTNNRMELLAVIEGLKRIKRKENIVVFTDSRYIIDSVKKKRIFEWEKNNFYKKKNVDLWKIFIKLFLINSISFQWIKSHNNHFCNDYCDRLSEKASKKINLQIDYVYEKINGHLQ
ncbi:ribonuclease H family protein [Blattabacterium cuenoti]|uniref:ribonuclease H family protein n=1 Tax=Blattabacterium cuenoti TaxID=1653831 RepID=UPI00163BD370|nr:ribonuclease H [Blattabacterium cuenoti]